jgi:hypothetical protein
VAVTSLRVRTVEDELCDTIVVLEWSAANCIFGVTQQSGVERY